MQSTPSSAAPSRKKTLLSVLILLALTGVLVLVFKDNWDEIRAALSQLRLWQVLLVLALGLTHPLLEGVCNWIAVRSRMPHYPLRCGLDVSWLGVFGNVAAFGAGSVPMQMYYLYRCGLPVGPGAGLLTLQYVSHKCTVLLYASVMLLVQGQWLRGNTTGLLRYLPLAYLIVAGIILILVALCVSPLVQKLARRLLSILPDTEVWQARRESWMGQLDALSTESRHLLQDKRRCLTLFAVQTFKLFLLFSLPYLCLQFMQLPCELSFWQVQLLAALTLFISNALPNVAGMGSVEAAFLLVFTGLLGQGAVMSTLMLYRIASYYAVFAASVAGFFFAQRRAAAMHPKAAQ